MEHRTDNMSAKKPVPPKHFGGISVANDMQTTDAISLPTRFTVTQGVVHDDITVTQRGEFRKAARGSNPDGIERWHSDQEGGKEVVSITAHMPLHNP